MFYINNYPACGGFGNLTGWSACLGGAAAEEAAVAVAVEATAPPTASCDGWIGCVPVTVGGAGLLPGAVLLPGTEFGIAIFGCGLPDEGDPKALDGNGGILLPDGGGGGRLGAFPFGGWLGAWRSVI